MRSEPEEALEEIFAGEWETEKRCGILHYVSAQYKAVETTDDDGEQIFLLGFTPIDGHGIIGIFCYLRGGAWEPEGFRIRVDGLGERVFHNPPDFELSTPMIRALETAVCE